MKIDEAIKHAREVADCCKSEISTFPNPEPYERYCNSELEKRAEEHEQLAEWLEELKGLREVIKQIRNERDLAIQQLEDLGGSFGEKPELIYQRIYNKALDDFERKVLDNCPLTTKDGEKVLIVRMDIFKFIIEQLKKGGK